METKQEQAQKPKKKSGFAYLREKLAQANTRIKQMREAMEESDKTIGEQAMTISKQAAEIAEVQSRLLSERAQYERTVDELCEHMGWFRRWLWDLKHANK